MVASKYNPFKPKANEKGHKVFHNDPQDLLTLLKSSVGFVCVAHRYKPTLRLCRTTLWLLCICGITLCKPYKLT